MNSIQRYVFLFVCVISVSCTVRRYQEPKKEPARDVLMEIEIDIRRVIGDASCGGQSDCAMISLLGRRGSPIYIAYNRMTVDEDRLMELLAEYRQATEIIRKEGGFSRIMYNPQPPKAFCIDGHCTLVRLPNR